MSEPPIIHVKRPNREGVAQSASMGEVLSSFQSLRASVLGLFQATGVDPTRTRELARELGVNRGLAWRLSRMARSQDGTDVAHDVPGRQSLEKFAKVCQDRGASDEVVNDALEAIEEFERAVGACSGGRKTLAMLLANRGESTAATDRERARRSLFEGACSVWGVQAQMRFVTVFLFPSPSNPAYLDAAHVTGYLGFRRLSPRPWPMSYEAVHDSEGQAQEIRKEPLDPRRNIRGEPQLLTAFCDPPSPKIEVRTEHDYRAFDLAAGPVGNEGLTTCVFGSYLNQIYENGFAQPETAGFMVLLQTPVERVMFDLFVHEDIRTEGPVITHLLDRLKYPHDNRESGFDRQSMAISETARDLPRGRDAAATASIPFYPQLLSFIADRVKIPTEKFAGSRFEMTYPPISTTLSRRIPLTPRTPGA